AAANEPVAERKGVRLTTTVAPDVPLIMSDWEKVRRILVNLASNAVQFTPAGGSVDVAVSYDASRDEVIMSVIDTGIGIPADKHELVFERFTQENMSTVRRYGGSGLGLSLVKDLSSMLGGWVSLESALGEGSTFKVGLPVKAVEEQKEN
ncbi:MAG: histidine kinase, partial [Eggerthellaceae bacterium]|nr:histidine kinase [Eggerthellaceae bacterium]